MSSKSVLPLLLIAGGAAALFLSGASTAEASTDEAPSPQKPTGKPQGPGATPGGAEAEAGPQERPQGPAPAAVRPPAAPPSGGGGKPPAPAAVRPPAGDDFLEAAELAASQPPPPVTTTRPKPPAVPSPSPSPAAVVTVHPAQLQPSGYNAAAAKAIAPGLAKHIKAAGYSYTRGELVKFQRAAGIPADGVYGPLSASALKHFAGSAPAPLFKGAKGAPSSYREP